MGKREIQLNKIRAQKRACAFSRKLGALLKDHHEEGEGVIVLTGVKNPKGENLTIRGGRIAKNFWTVL